MKITGAIFASGQGLRLKEISDTLKRPKHLFPIGSDVICSKTLKEMISFCNETMVITNQKDINTFKDVLGSLNLYPKIIAKTVDGFSGDFAALKEALGTHIFITTGDLIFPPKELEKFHNIIKRYPTKLIICFDKTAITKFSKKTGLDFRILMGAFPREILHEISTIDPENFFQVIKYILRHFFRIKICFLNSLFNINTPKIYQEAVDFFKRS